MENRKGGRAWIDGKGWNGQGMHGSLLKLMSDKWSSQLLQCFPFFARAAGTLFANGNVVIVNINELVQMSLLLVSVDGEGGEPGKWQKVESLNGERRRCGEHCTGTSRLVGRRQTRVRRHDCLLLSAFFRLSATDWLTGSGPNLCQDPG